MNTAAIDLTAFLATALYLAALLYQHRTDATEANNAEMQASGICPACHCYNDSCRCFDQRDVESEYIGRKRIGPETDERWPLLKP